MSRLVVLLVVALAACSAHPGPDVQSVEELPTTRAAAPAAPATPSGRTQAGPPDQEPLPPYASSVGLIGPPLRERMRFSHRSGCPLSWTELRHLRISFVGFDGKVHMGEMVVHRDHAADVVAAFGDLYDAHWPIRRMQLVDHYEGDDDRSMAANNTSGYNCRRVTSGDAWSSHAYGAAIDINPVQNPYVTTAWVLPPLGRRFAAIDRSADAKVPVGAIREGDVVVRAFSRIGWEWGGDWSASKDYQHFSASGR